MNEYLIENTTKEQRIALIKSWIPDDEAMDDSEIDLWDMYADYINGTKEISECNAAFSADYLVEEQRLIMNKAKYFIYLHLILMLFSISAVFSKLAAGEEALSFKWILYYGIVLFIMFVYAICWQQIIKKMPIVTAYANKVATVIWGIIWGVMIFKENITVPKLIGTAIIIVGVYLVVTGDEEVE